jgi:hypothetical protein
MGCGEFIGVVFFAACSSLTCKKIMVKRGHTHLLGIGGGIQQAAYQYVEYIFQQIIYLLKKYDSQDIKKSLMETNRLFLVSLIRK